jgi:hypothetical protein
MEIGTTYLIMSDEKEILLREHEELIQLFIHEDSMAWNLINYYLVVNIGILSVIGVLLSQPLIAGKIISIILCVVGGIFGLFWVSVRESSEKHRKCRVDKALQIEKKLNDKLTNTKIDTCKEVLSGTGGALKNITYGMWIIAVGWFIAGSLLGISY